MAPHEVACLGLDFSVMESVVSRRVVDLCPGGAERDVDASNVAEYLEACRQLGVAESDLFAGTDLIYNRYA